MLLPYGRLVLCACQHNSLATLDCRVVKLHQIRTRCRVVPNSARLLNCSPVGTSKTLPADWRNDEQLSLDVEGWPGWSRLPGDLGFVRRRDPYLQPGHCGRAARGVGADRHDDRAFHYRCGVVGDDCDGFGRDGCTGEAQGSWRLSSARACSVRSSLPRDEYSAALVHPAYSWCRYGTDGCRKISRRLYQAAC